VQPGPELIDFSDATRLQVVALTRRIRPQRVGLSPGGLLHFLRLDFGVVHHVAGLFLRQPQDVIGAAAYARVVDSADRFAGGLELILQ
jgi:hypothetical protein